MSGLLTALAVLLGLALLAALALAAFTARVAWRVEKALPARGRFLEIGGQRLHYLEQGEGPPLVLIHGLTGQLGNFAYALLEPLSQNHRVVLVDRPGSGHSTRDASFDAGLAVQAGIVAEAIERLGLERPLVVGHSLGGAVALSLALNHPEKVAALALVAPLTQPTRDVPAVFRLLAVRPLWARRIIAWTVATPMAILNRRAVLHTVFGPDRAPKDFGLAGGGFWSMRPASFVAASADLHASAGEMEGLRARYGELAVPVAVLFGREDRILSAERHGRLFATQAPGAIYEEIEGGHMIPVTAAPHVVAFIESVERRLVSGRGVDPETPAAPAT